MSVDILLKDRFKVIHMIFPGYWTAIFAPILMFFGLVSCSGGGSSSLATANNPGKPTVSVTAATSLIAYNTSTIVTWSSTNSSSCSSSVGKGTEGSFNTGPLTASNTYTVLCTGAGGSASGSVTISVAPSVITGFADAGGGYVTTTSENSLANGDIIKISGSTNYDGTYVVSNPTATRFDIPATYTGNDATGIWQLAGGMINGCTTTGSTGAIALSNVPSRFNGVAPLAIFFDATETTATATTRPFHDIEYRWDFGDKIGSVLNLSPPLTGTSTWNAGSRAGISSRNKATGPVSAHVYETPGTYIVNLSATDGTHTVSNSCAQIVVQDPEVVFSGTHTVCFGATGMPTAGAGGCPSGASVAHEQDFATAINNHANTGKRLLFKRNDIFTTTTGASITATGPGIIGSYGSGALPVVQLNSNDSLATVLTFSSRTTPSFRDWRVMDMEFDGMSNSASYGLGAGGGFSQITSLRMTFRNFNTALGCDATSAEWWNDHQGPYGQSVDQTAIVDSTVTAGPNTQYISYLSGNRLAFMGNDGDNGGNQIITDSHGKVVINPTTGNPQNGSHATRWTYLGKAVISNNTIMRPGLDRHVMKIHAPTWINGIQPPNQPYQGDGYTKLIVISDNKFGDHLNPWSIVIGPQDSQTDERVRDIIFERNLYLTTPNSQAGNVIRGHEITIRNNIYAGNNTFTLINVDGAETPAENVWIFNNTQYSAESGVDFVMVKISDSRVSNITITNNLAYAPNTSNPLLYSDAGASNVVVANNSTDYQVKNVSPLLTATPPLLITDWTPTTGSYANNVGAAVPVWSDLYLNQRPQGVIDIGAVETP